jgi:site-specific recombinase XerD
MGLVAVQAAWVSRRARVRLSPNATAGGITADDVVKELGYEHLCRHSLRHTGLTWMADAGAPVHVLRMIAGHGSITTTQRYLHPDKRAIWSAGDSLSAHLRAPRSPNGPQRRSS